MLLSVGNGTIVAVWYLQPVIFHFRFLKRYIFQRQYEVIEMVLKERRSYVRGDFAFTVKFGTMTHEEYEAAKRTGGQILSSGKKNLIIDGADTDNRDSSIPLSSGLVDFLLGMDEKLDHIMGILSKDKADEGLLNQGTVVNISGSGMNLEVDRQVQYGQIIHANFVLSKIPLIVMDVFGEVVRVTPLEDDGKTWYRLGIRFLDLNECDRENIIACVFQRQRETIRKSKNGNPGPGLITTGGL